MSKSLSDLRKSDLASLPERSYDLCLAAGLVAEVEKLLHEQAAIMSTRPTDEDGNSAGPPMRLGEGEEPRVTEIRARLAEIADAIEEHTGELRLRALTDGEWRRWVNAHPAREKNERDEIIAYGFCDADALADSLGLFAHTWNGEPIRDGDWDFIASKAASGDLRELTSTVVQMHEVALDLGKGLASWRGSPQKSND